MNEENPSTDATFDRLLDELHGIQSGQSYAAALEWTSRLRAGLDAVTFSPACRGGGFLLKNPSGFSIDRLSPHALWFARFMSRATR